MISTNSTLLQNNNNLTKHIEQGYFSPVSFLYQFKKSLTGNHFFAEEHTSHLSYLKSNEMQKHPGYLTRILTPPLHLTILTAEARVFVQSQNCFYDPDSGENAV